MEYKNARMKKSITTFWLVIALIGCGARNGPVDAMQSYLAAVADGKTEVAWRLLSSEAQNTITQSVHREQISALTPEQREALRDTAKSLKSGSATLKFQYASGGISVWTKSGKEWRISEFLLDRPLLGTPLQALKSFIAAVRAGDYKTVLELAPAAERESLTTALLSDRFGHPRFRGEVLAAVDALENAGHGAARGKSEWRFEHGGHYAAFINEGGAWRLLDLK